MSRALDAARELGCRAVQVFLRAPSRWAAAPLAAAEAVRFRSASAEMQLAGACFAHAPYLLNLASADETLRGRSIIVLVEELQRAGELGLDGVVLHPGSARDGERRSAARRCRAAIAAALELAGKGAARLVLEATAGTGGHLGATPAELAELVGEELRESVGVCLDTAHLWAVGYNLRRRGWQKALRELAEHWGRERPDLLHLNDTAVALGGRRDRHAPPGEGVLGRGFFRSLLTDERLAALPMVMEIPPGKGNSLVRAALDRLQSWSV